MQTATHRVPDRLVRDVLAAPRVRPEAVARARVLLHSAGWECRADEVASELVDAMVSRRLP